MLIGSPNTRCSTSGCCFFFSGILVSWSLKRQTTISKSGAELEYRGMANVTSKTCWLRNLLLELHFPLTMTTLVYCDNNPVQQH